MRLLVLVCLLALLPGLRAWGQAGAACGSGRYAADVFAVLDSTMGITYGQNTVRDYSQGIDTPKTLQLDFYQPAGDVAAQRPLIIFAFGGAYVSGQRTDMADLCRAFARKGYATATIDYRLVPPGVNGYNYGLVFSSRARLSDQLVRAVSDLKAAVRFFRRDAATANAYHIDPTKIFVAGYSAGAITALLTTYVNSVDEDSNLTAAYQANGGLEGNTDLPAPNNTLPAYNADNLAGAFSLAGAVARLSVVKATDPPLYAAHGDADTTVPYNSGTAFGSTPYVLYGGGAIHARADSVGLRNQLYTIAGGNHGSTRVEPYRTAITTAAAAFFENLLCAAPLPVVLASFTGQLNPTTCTATLRWRTASETGSLAYEVQRSTDGAAFSPVARVPSRNSPTGAAYAYDAGPLSEPAYFRLQLLDADGSSRYSPVVSLSASCAAPAFSLAPNPVQQRLTVAGLPAGHYRAEVLDPTGRRVAAATGPAPLTLELAALPPGLYWVRVTTEAGQQVGQGRIVR